MSSPTSMEGDLPTSFPAEAQESTQVAGEPHDYPPSVYNDGSAVRKRTRPQESEQPANRRTPTFQERTKKLMIPKMPLGEAPGFFQSIKAVILASWLNVLLVFIPVSWALNFALNDDIAKKDTIVFITCFLAIIPLAKLLAFATDELSMRVGQTLAGLLNATLGNANLLLVLGMCFFAGGLKYSEQGFGASATQLNSSLLTLSVIAVLLPAAFHFSVAGSGDTDEGSDILQLSRGASIILLFIYGSYLVFQLYSHTSLYDDHGEDITKSTVYSPRSDNHPMTRIKKKAEKLGFHSSEPHNGDVESGGEKGDHEETPQMNVWTTLGLLAVVTVLVAVTAEFLVDSINGMTDAGGISKEFVGIILLPIVGNAAEHVTAVTVSVKDKLTLSLGVAVGSSI
ncbi:hypothetical protein C0991_010030 [Blastosporella zonata]|nr:hypothetical protein C0991_010030 [Blastosporella zonata]